MRFNNSSKFARVTTAGAASLLLLTTAACGDSTDTEDTSSGASDALEEVTEISALLPEEIAEKGTLVVGTATYPPAVIVDSDGSDPYGWDVSTAIGIAEILGLEPEIQVLAWDGLIPGLEANRFDVAVGEMAVLPERMEILTFVANHVSGTAFLVKADSEFDTFAAPADVCGLSLSVLLGSSETLTAESISAECVEAGSDPVDIQTFKDQPTANLAVSEGRVDASLSSASQVAFVVDQTEGQFKLATNEFSDEMPTGMALAVTDYEAEFAVAIEAATNHLIETGRLQEILDEYNGGLGGVDRAVIMPEPTS